MIRRLTLSRCLMMASPAEVSVGGGKVVHPRGLGVELSGGLDHDIGWARNQAMGLEQAANRGFLYEVALILVNRTAISTIWPWMSSPMRFYTRLGADGLLLAGALAAAESRRF